MLMIYYMNTIVNNLVIKKSRLSKVISYFYTYFAEDKCLLFKLVHSPCKPSSVLIIIITNNLPNLFTIYI